MMKQIFCRDYRGVRCRMRQQPIFSSHITSIGTPKRRVPRPTIINTSVDNSSNDISTAPLCVISCFNEAFQFYYNMEKQLILFGNIPIFLGRYFRKTHGGFATGVWGIHPIGMGGRNKQKGQIDLFQSGLLAN